MSLIIEGMGMPQAGDIIVCGRIDGKLQCTIITRGKPTKWCEVLEVSTPHGRLIDDFKLLRALIKAFPNQSMNFYDTLERVIDEAPIIIEAEESE